MVTISVDEAYAFDILSIFEIKIENSDCSEKTKINQYAHDLMLFELKKQIDNEYVDEVISSKEYLELKNVNRETFELVDMARSSDITTLAKQVDNANVKRFDCKKRLQNEFFDGNMLETKI